MSEYIIPVIVILLLLLCLRKKINAYDCFTEGAKESVKLTLSIFPYIAAIFVSVYLFRASGLATLTAEFLDPVFRFVGIPSELVEIVLLKPLSGNGSLAILESMFQIYGPDSYIARCASVIMNSGETVFYIAAIYFSATSVRKLKGSIAISLIATTIGAIVACLLCRYI